jgi:hypothetical protein
VRSLKHVAFAAGLDDRSTSAVNVGYAHDEVLLTGSAVDLSPTIAPARPFPASEVDHGS